MIIWETPIPCTTYDGQNIGFTTEHIKFINKSFSVQLYLGLYNDHV